MSLGNPVYCVQCKRELSADDDYCGKCGQPQRKGLTPRTVASESDTTQALPKESTPVLAASFTPTPTTLRTNRPKTTAGSLGAGILVVVLSAVGITARIWKNSYRASAMESRQTQPQVNFDPGAPARSRQTLPDPALVRSQQEAAARDRMVRMPMTNPGMSYQNGIPGSNGATRPGMPPYSGLPMDTANQRLRNPNPLNDPQALSALARAQNNRNPAPATNVPGEVPQLPPGQTSNEGGAPSAPTGNIPSAPGTAPEGIPATAPAGVTPQNPAQAPPAVDTNEPLPR